MDKELGPVAEAAPGRVPRRICIYHGNCADGFTAAWVVRNRFAGEEIQFHAGTYGDPPPDVTGLDVILVDFSYKRPVMEEIVRKAASVLVLDHHKTAEEDLRGLEGAAVVFDMERSGAGIAWDYFYPGYQRPRLIDHVEDRDLWRFALPLTREIQAAVFSYEYDFKNWDSLAASIMEDLAKEGAAIERKHHKDIRELSKVVTRIFEVGGHKVPIANLPYTLTSDAGHLLAEGYPFAGCYWDTPGGRVFSLRSREDGADVSEIAKLYGGGGHKHAAGFRVPYSHALCSEVSP